MPGIGRVKHARQLEKLEMVSLIINIIVDLNSRSEELFLFIKLINIEILYKACKVLKARATQGTVRTVIKVILFTVLL